MMRCEWQRSESPPPSLAGAGRRLGRRRRLLSLGAQFEQPQQDLVALRLQFGNRARADLSMNALDEFLLHFGRQLWLPENLKYVAALVVMIIILLFRPQGILGRRERIG